MRDRDYLLLLIIVIMCLANCITDMIIEQAVIKTKETIYKLHEPRYICESLQTPYNHVSNCKKGNKTYITETDNNGNVRIDIWG